MGIVVDVDAHFEPGDEWLRLYPELAARVPALDLPTLAVKGAFGDFVEAIPADRRPPMSELFPPGLLTLFAQEKAEEKGRKQEFEGSSMRAHADAAARLKWMDAQGIDIQNVICLSHTSYTSSTDDVGLRQEIVAAANDWLADMCAKGEGRLLPVTNLDYSDLGWAVAELGRMRRRGSRMALIPGAPVDGISPAHPDWDRFWKAITDNGMIAMFHVGSGRLSFEPGWTNMGGDITLMRQFGSSFHHFEPQLLLTALTLGGVFERHPTLTVLTAEVGVGWMPVFVRHIDERATAVAQLWLGKWKYPLLPSEYVRRNVRGTPLDWGLDRPLDKIMELLPEDMIVFSSDFPHFEGLRDPKSHYASLLDQMGERRRELFFGGSVLQAYERLGDPLLLAPQAVPA